MNKPVRFDRRARRRMKWRKISEEETYLVLENPDKIETSIQGRVNAYKSMDEDILK